MTKKSQMTKKSTQLTKKRKRGSSEERGFTEAVKDYLFPSPANQLERLYTSDKERRHHSRRKLRGIDREYRHFIKETHGSRNEEVPKYPKSLEDKKRIPKILINKAVDIISLLSNPEKKRFFLVRNNGDQVHVDTLKGKYIIVCCFFLPICSLADVGAGLSRALIALYNELRGNNNNDFEMVVVAKMRRGWGDNQAAFDHFFSAFPCLTIPFWDSESRDYVCLSLGLKGAFHHTAGLVVGPDGRVLRDDDRIFGEYGADSFPFTERRFKELRSEDERLTNRLSPFYQGNTVDCMKDFLRKNYQPVSLEELLDCDPSLVVPQLSGSSDNNDQFTVSKLSEKLVGVYICNNGLFLDKLHEVHQLCLARGLEFEIILVCPNHEDDTSTSLHHLRLALAQRHISSWRVIWGCKDSTSRRLNRICSRHTGWDDLLILPPAGKFPELRGRQVIHCFGVDAYPFTRLSLIERRLARLRSLTLESLLEGFDHLIRDKAGSPLPVSHLRGKNIILLFDDVLDKDCEWGLYKMMLELYANIRAEHPDEFEVVFVPQSRFSHHVMSKLPWLNLSHDSDVYPSVTKQLFLKEELITQDEYMSCYGCGIVSTLVAFGVDGHLQSRHAQFILKEYGVDAVPFADTLHEEIVKDLNVLEEDEDA